MNESESHPDYSKLGISIGLPPLDGAEPSATCPICGRAQIPPESDDGWPPAGEYHYACDASYVLPEDETLPQVLEPCKPCNFVPTRLALAWLRDRSEADPALTKVASTIRRVVPQAPPYRVEARSPLAISPPRPEGARTLATCPICGAATMNVSESFHRYVCGGSFWSTQLRPGPDGSMIPEVWQAFSSCNRAPVAVVLRVLQARNEPEWKAVCDEALAALG
jgi:endogenous inhibitor of DNA gyrase (YacG/DUF329 family)